VDPLVWLVVVLAVVSGWWLVDLGRRQLRNVEEVIAELLEAREVDEPDPPRGAPLVEEAVRAGFDRVTSLRTSIDGTTLMSTLCVSPDGVILDVTWAEDERTPPPALSLDSVLDGGRATLATQTLAHLPAASDELRQAFPDADVSTLLARHREGLAWLATRGLEPDPIPPASVVEWFERANRRSAEVARAARWQTGIAIWWRQRRGRHLDLGPLRAQPGIDARLAALRGQGGPVSGPIDAG
jgi:hypothetical protein